MSAPVADLPHLVGKSVHAIYHAPAGSIAISGKLGTVATRYSLTALDTKSGNHASLVFDAQRVERITHHADGSASLVLADA